MLADDRSADSSHMLSGHRLHRAVDTARHFEPEFVHDRAGHASLRLAVGGLVVWLGCMTLLSCVGSVISVTEVCGR